MPARRSVLRHRSPPPHSRVDRSAFSPWPFRWQRRSRYCCAPPQSCRTRFPADRETRSTRPLAAACQTDRRDRSAACVHSTGGPHPRRSRPAAAKIHDAAPPSAPQHPNWTTNDHQFWKRFGSTPRAARDTVLSAVPATWPAAAPARGSGLYKDDLPFFHIP